MVAVPTEPLTADTVTDEQIRELLSDLVTDGGAGTSYAEDCRVALYDLHTKEGRESNKFKARARCAEIINERRAQEEDESNPNDAESSRRDRGLPARDGTTRMERASGARDGK